MTLRIRAASEQRRGCVVHRMPARMYCGVSVRCMASIRSARPRETSPDSLIPVDLFLSTNHRTARRRRTHLHGNRPGDPQCDQPFELADFLAKAAHARAEF